MAEESFPFQELAEGDRTVSAAMFAKHFGMFRTRGVVQNIDNELAVSASSPAAMSVDVDSGAAFVGLTELRAYRNTLARTLTVNGADPSDPRNDLVVLDMDTATSPSDTRRVTALIVPGTPAPSPVDPALTQDEDHYQLPIARIVVPAAASSIGAGDLTDLRTFSTSANLPQGFVTRITTNVTQVGTDADTTEKELASYTLPSGRLAVDGQALRVTVWGSSANNNNGKTVRLKFGATTVVSSGLTIGTSNGTRWTATATIVRSGATAQEAVASFIHNTQSANGNNSTVDQTEPAETLSAPVDIKVTGQNGAASTNDIVFHGMVVEFLE